MHTTLPLISYISQEMYTTLLTGITALLINLRKGKHSSLPCCCSLVLIAPKTWYFPSTAALRPSTQPLCKMVTPMHLYFLSFAAGPCYKMNSSSPDAHFLKSCCSSFLGLTVIKQQNCMGCFKILHWKLNIQDAMWSFTLLTPLFLLQATR